MEILECASFHKIVDTRQVVKMHILQSYFYEDLTTNLIKHSLTKLFIAICSTTLFLSVFKHLKVLLLSNLHLKK
jgi:hypothetical protein